MTLAAAPTPRTDTPTQAVDAARVLGGCRGPGASVRLQESGLLDLTLLSADSGIAPSTAAEVVRIVAVSHLDLARQLRQSLLADDHAVGHDLVARLLDIALEAGSAAAALHGAVAALREGDRRDGEARRRLGELSVAVAAAEATLAAAGSAVDAVRASTDDPALLHDEATVAVTTASVLASRAAADTSRAVVDLRASAVADAAVGLDVLGAWALTGRIAP
ncbi:MAG: hypothetical protein PGN29_06090 [Gordonia paraffinivorans]